MGFLFYLCPACKQRSPLGSTKCSNCGVEFSLDDDAKFKGEGFTVKRVRPDIVGAEERYLKGSTVGIVFGWVLWILVYFIFFISLISEEQFSKVAHSYLIAIHLFFTIAVPLVFVIAILKIKRNIIQKRKTLKNDPRPNQG